MATMTKTAMQTTVGLEALGELLTSARHLIREIEKRDGEGNTIPEHLYAGLKRSVAAVTSDLVRDIEGR